MPGPTPRNTGTRSTGSSQLRPNWNTVPLVTADPALQTFPIRCLW